MPPSTVTSKLVRLDTLYIFRTRVIAMPVATVFCILYQCRRCSGLIGRWALQALLD